MRRKIVPLLAGATGFVSVIFLMSNGMSSFSAQTTTLMNGAGATFPFPLYSKWFYEYYKIDPEVEINYQSIGSGGGIRQFLHHTIDFGASDTPMTDQQLARSSTPILHIPTVLGAAALTYNLPGISQGLKLTPALLADLYLGKITKWTDPRITQLNPELSLPNEPVIIVCRSDGSGTTAVFTDYLSKVSLEWRSKVGTGTAVNWPVGLGGKGNEGVAGLIKQTPGTIGYVELVYAESNNLPYAALQNQSGNFILPSLKSVTAAAEGSLKDIPTDLRASITNAKGKDTYPLSSFTYLLVYQVLPKGTGEKIIDFLHWALHDGQKYAEKLYYSPLPLSLVKRVDDRIQTITLR